MFHQLLTPVAGSLPLSFLVAVLPIATVLVLLGLLRRPAWQASLAGLVVGLVIAVTAWQMPGLPGARQCRRRCGVRAVAGDVDRLQRPAALQHRRCLRPLRRLPRLGAQPPAERPARRAGRHRLLLRLPAGGHLRLRHPGRDHQRAADPGRLPAAGGADLHPDLQHRAGGVRRPRRAGHRAGAGHRTAGGATRRHDRPPVAVPGHAAAVLRDDPVWRAALCPGAVADAAGGGRQLRGRAVRVVQFPGLRADRRAVVADRADRDAGLPARSGSRRPIRPSPSAPT